MRHSEIFENSIHDMPDDFKQDFIQTVKKFKKKNQIPEWQNNLEVPYLRKIKEQGDWEKILETLKKLIKIEPFSRKTGLPLYDDMLKSPEYFREKKGKEFEIVEMSPSEYIHQCALGFKTNEENLRKTRDVNYFEKMLEGEQFPMPLLDYSGNHFGQEGLHRAMAAEYLGIRKIPVMVISKVEEMKAREIFEKEDLEKLELPDLEVGDTLMVGRFKNRAATIKGFEKDKHGQPIAKTNKGKQQIFKGRVKKLMPEDLNEEINARELEDLVRRPIELAVGRRNSWETPGLLTKNLRKALTGIIKDYLESHGVTRAGIDVTINLNLKDYVDGRMWYGPEYKKAMFKLGIPKQKWHKIMRTAAGKGRSDELTDLIDDFIEEIVQGVTHELMHGFQWAASKGKIANRTGILGKRKNNSFSDVYLSDKHELSPYAANAVQEMLQKKISGKKLLPRLGEDQIQRYLTSKSETWNLFYQTFKMNPSEKHQKVWKRFVKKVVQHWQDRLA